jgi:D-lactate dehydrogenase (cytochrome)
VGGVGRLTQQRWASNDRKSGGDEKPFYHQLQESIFERVQKEKAEQIRIQSLQQRTARGQFFATLSGMLLFFNSISMGWLCGMKC